MSGLILIYLEWALQTHGRAPVQIPYYTNPCASMASATFTKPPTLAPFT